MSGGPYFVIDFDIKKNILIVSQNTSDLLKKETILCPYNLLIHDKLEKNIEIKAKIRSQSNLVKASLLLINNTKAKIIFNKQQKAVTPGQFAVFYQKNKCIGAGKIVN